MNLKIVNIKLFLLWIVLLSITLGIITGFIVSNRINESNRYYSSPVISIMVEKGDTLESISEEYSSKNNFRYSLFYNDTIVQNSLNSRMNMDLREGETIRIHSFNY